MTKDIVITVDTRQVERAIKLNKKLLDLKMEIKRLDGKTPPLALKGRTLDKRKGRTV